MMITDTVVSCTEPTEVFVAQASGFVPNPLVSRHAEVQFRKLLPVLTC